MAAARAAWPADAEAGVGGIAPERPVFLDECGVLTGMARLHGRSPRGTRASGEVPHGSWTRLSVPGALGRAVHDAATNAFIHGLSVGALVAGGVAAAGAVLAAVFLPAQPVSPAVTPPPPSVPAANPAGEPVRP